MKRLGGFCERTMRGTAGLHIRWPSGSLPNLGRTFGLCCLLPLSQFPGLAAPILGPSLGRVACGAPRHASEPLVLHRQHSVERRQDGPRFMELPAEPPADVGDIAIIEASRETWAPEREFDLSGSAVSITPEGETFKVQSASVPGGVPISEIGIWLDLEDDDSALIDLPFQFPFYGRTYGQVYVQSDGNLTFLFPEARSDPRTYTRAAIGPPRICPLFRDLDPSVGGRVRVDARPDAVTVSWVEVPVYSESNTGRPQTFQVTLGAGGDIEFRYGDVDVPNAVIGLFTGNANSGVDVVDWSEADGAELHSANIVAEVFVEEKALDEFAIAHSFFRGHEDAYDTLVIFNDLGIDASRYSFAHQFTVRNEVKGVGDFDVNYGTVFGSPRRLSSFVNMGPLTQYPPGPTDPIPGLLGDSMLTVLAHEVGHRHLAYPQFVDPETGEDSDLLLGRQIAHWSFFFNSEASVLEGNAIVDNGRFASPRFVTGEPSQRFAKLDQYLMGLLDPSEVPAFFLVTSPVTPRTDFRPGLRFGSAARSPEEGIEFDGVRKDLRVEDIVLKEGPRRPDWTVAQRHFRHGFALVVAEGEQPKPQSLATLQDLRRHWLAFFESNFGARASATTGVARMLHLSTWPAAGLIAGSSGSAQVEIGAPLETDFDVHLRLDTAIATIPAVVTIPAGEATVAFELEAQSAGIATLFAEAPVAGYSRAVTRLVVREDPVGLELEAGQPEQLHGVANRPATLRFRVRDSNLVHYSGVEMEFCATGYEECPAATSVTDAGGVVPIHWPFLDSASEQTLTVQIAGLPDVRLETNAVVALETPMLDPLLAANAASGAVLEDEQGFAPGSLITLAGTGLAADQQVYGTRLVPVEPEDGGEPMAPRSLPRELAGTRVSVAGVAAPLTSVSPSAVTLQVPFGVATDRARIVVTTPFGSVPAIEIPIAPVHPGIFPQRIVAGTLERASQSFQPADGLPVAGGLIALYCTGLGAVSPPGRTGRPGLDYPVQEVVARIRAWIDGETANVAGCALDNEDVGFYEVLLRLPSGLSAGSHSVWISADGQASNRVQFESR